MAKILYPFSIAYRALSALDRKVSAPRCLDAPVISVGNLTWGGTGKTPLVIELLKFLVKNNLKPVVLTRGYGRSGKIPLLLKNGAPKVNPANSGDEPLLIAKSVPEACVIVAADRYAAALSFRNKINPDVYVLDDGFQHWKIKRDLDIVCINASNPFGNGMLIPAGSLREKPSALKRAGLIIITNSDTVCAKRLLELKKEISKYSKAPVAFTYYGGLQYKKIDLKTNFNFKLLKNSKTAAISGIGFSEGFRKSVEKTGIVCEKFISLKDHKKYDKKMLEKIFASAGKESYFITTSKDAVKINAVLDEKNKKRVAVLTAAPQFKNGKEIWEKTILRKIKKR
ncbi:tetraacyldisaccharide 4'-kinase [Endomicrobium proavitum]|uniref:Tetraacyldisaccharide 4'-kinase n=1 Tax=Endomicrobium proavitum TaxID=1408281 RepID=A0A0G3WIA0_9BACT|nr:tetraacyldisaccharide 4'-kinase [Endomicrobium proavitum]AKL97610.1 putative Tetraacyldisaccharide 4-kinase, lipid A 4kinase [Endomicrobium proavitum]